MMNHMQGGPQGQQHLHSPVSHHGHPRRDYHQYAPSPQSPIHPQPYMNYQAQYYSPHNPYTPQPRWHPQQYQAQQYQAQQYQAQQYMPQQMQMSQYPPRSPMMVHSPHRPPSMPHISPQNTQSPRLVSQYMHYQSQPMPHPATSTPFTPSVQPTEAPEQHFTKPKSESANQSQFEPSKHIPGREYTGPLPWYFPPGESRATFPKASAQRRRRRRVRRAPQAALAIAENTSEESSTTPKVVQQVVTTKSAAQASDNFPTPTQSIEEPHSEASTLAAPSEPETPATSHAPSETEFAAVSTPAAPAQPHVVTSPKPSTAVPLQNRRNTRSAIAVPNLPNLSRAKPTSPSPVAEQEQAGQESEAPVQAQQEGGELTAGEAISADTTSQASSIPPPAAAPVVKSWADLVRRNAPPPSAGSTTNGEVVKNGLSASKSASLAEALKQYNVRDDVKLSFLEPRGLVNTGNMCYMNSVLQVLVFCAPFYSFLDQVRQRTVHSIKSETPLVDAMIMFMREFNVLASAESVKGLRGMLKQDQLEVYGDPVTPEYVYDVIRSLPRFAGMRRGHQQDAEEFLGFLLEGLHDECAHVMQGSSGNEHLANGATPVSTEQGPNSTDEWQEVGPKQKAALTRTAGQEEAPSPITKIFGGHLRSELRVPGLQTSAVYEPFKPLQLDIGAPDVNNIVDALKGLTRIESLDGQFGGRTNTAKKQVFIHDLPPVLILHLKRFEYVNNLTGTQKIWKKVGYPLELEIPKEVFAPGERKSLAAKGGLPRYRLTGVVYHHGKSAAGGHYTVDVLRQDGREWVRMDDTYIRRVRSSDVAQAGAEEDPKVLAKALAEQQQSKTDQTDLPSKLRNPYQGLDDDPDDDTDAEGEQRPWSAVNGANHSSNNSLSNGSPAAGNSAATSHNISSHQMRKENTRDNKVAYILLYERIHL